MAPHTTWLAPNLLSERGEFVRTALALGLDLEELLRRASEAGLEPLTDAMWSQLQNTDSYTTDTMKKADKFAREYNRDLARVLDGMGKELPAPIVLLRKGKRPYLVGGNTRLMASRALGHTPKVLLVRM